MHTHTSTARRSPHSWHAHRRRAVLCTLLGFGWGMAIGMSVGGSNAPVQSSVLLKPQTLTARIIPAPELPRNEAFIPTVSAPPSIRLPPTSSFASRKRIVRRNPDIRYRKAATHRAKTVSGPAASAKRAVAITRSPAASSSVSGASAQTQPVRGPAASVERVFKDISGQHSRTSASSSAYLTGRFPAFTRTVYPVSAVPNWGAMHAAAEWNRTYDELSKNDLVPVPAYDLQKLLQPYKTLVNPRNEEEVTRKLVYSTKFFGAYDLDAKEFTANHPGVDIKLALDTPIGAIAGGRVHAVREAKALGTHVIIEHRHPTEGVLYSIYAHLGSVSVHAGQAVRPGDILGTVGMTGNTSAPHLHLQVDRGHGEAVHEPYQPAALPTPKEADRWVVHPIRLIEAHARGVREEHAAAQLPSR